MKKLPDSGWGEGNGGTGSSWFIFGAKDVVKFVGVMLVSVLTIGIYPAIILCKKTK